MTKKEKQVFDIWKNTRQYCNARAGELAEKIDKMYIANGGSNIQVVIADQIEYLVTLNAQTRHNAILALMNYMTMSVKSNIIRAIIDEIENAQKITA